MAKPFSTKNTKQEILDAYEKLTNELEHRDTNVVSQTPQKTFSQKTLPAPDEIIGKLSDVRIHVNKTLAQLTDTLVAESEKVQQLNTEKERIEKEIEEFHQITIHATTLKNLIELKEEERQKLEKTIAETRILWEAEQKQHLQQDKESQQEKTKQCQREEDEYQYNIKTKRQKEEDAYNKQKQSKEEELLKREEAVKAKEQEFQQLQKQVIDLQKQLETESIRIRKETADQVSKDLEVRYKLERKEIEGQQNLSKLIIDNLQKTIKAHEDEIKDLKLQLQKAMQQIKDIAVSVIDSKKPLPFQPQGNKQGE